LFFSYEKKRRFDGLFSAFYGPNENARFKNRGFARTCKVGFKKVVLTFGASHSSLLG